MRYVLTATQFNNTQPRTFQLVENDTSFTEDIGTLATCYPLGAFHATTSLGKSDALCAAPGVASFPAGGR